VARWTGGPGRTPAGYESRRAAQHLPRLDGAIRSDAPSLPDCVHDDAAAAAWSTALTVLQSPGHPDTAELEAKLHRVKSAH
jgi:hypothetical protein